MPTSLGAYGISTQRIIESMTRNDNNARRAMRRLATGLRLENAGEEPSTYALGRGHSQTRLGRIQAGIENLEQAIKFTDLRMDGLMNSRDKILRMMDIAVRAANEATLTVADMANMQSEIDALNEALADNQHVAFRLNNSDLTSKTLYNPGQLDVIWVMDQTGSMGVHIAPIQAAAPDMYDQLEAKGFELRMAAVGYGANASVNTTVTIPPGSPNNVLTGTGSKSLQATSAGFVADVNGIATTPTGAFERGIDAALEAIYATGIDAQLNTRPNAQRVMILLSDADSDDWGDTGANVGLTGTAQAIAARDYAVNTLNSWGISFYVVNSVMEGVGAFPGLGQDADYTDIATRTGGASMDMDPGNAWVTSISNTLQAFGGPWDLRFQWGPDGGDYLTHTVNTIMPTTLGTNGVNVTTAANAASSITTIEGAMDFLNESMTNTGALRNLLQRTLDTQLSEYTNIASMASRLLDTDLASEITNFVKTSIIQEGAVATLSHAMQSTDSIISLINSNLTTQASPAASAAGVLPSATGGEEA